MKEAVFLTKDLPPLNGTIVTILEDNTDVTVRFCNGTVQTVNRNNLYDPKIVPFKVGDEVKNIDGYIRSDGSFVCPGITWQIKEVTYNLPDLQHAVLVCDSSKVLLWGKLFLDSQIEKIE